MCRRSSILRAVSVLTATVYSEGGEVQLTSQALVQDAKERLDPRRCSERLCIDHYYHYSLRSRFQIMNSQQSRQERRHLFGGQRIVRRQLLN